MLFEIGLVILLYFVPVRTIPMTIYNNVWFNPSDGSYRLTNLASVMTLNMCACQCYNNSLCITGTYFSTNQTCALFSARVSQGQLQLIRSVPADVFSFSNRTAKIDSTNPPAIIQWMFDGNFNDVYNRYNGHLTDSSGGTIENFGAIWSSPGYAGYGSAVSFPRDTYALVDQYLDLTTTSFTVSAWVWVPTNFSSNDYDYFALFSHCEDTMTDKCLHIVVGNGWLRLGFYGDDLLGVTKVNLNKWYHVAYVYDRSTYKQLIYLNGILDGNRTSDRPYSGNASQIVLGPIPSFGSISRHNGSIDKLTFVSRVKNASELLDEATLVAYYSFDGSFVDLAANNITNITSVATTFDSAGRFNQALLISSWTSSYFQTKGFYYLGQSNYSYSFSLWIYPIINGGTILQVSSSNGWCVPMIGYNTLQHLTVQTLGIKGIYKASAASSILPLNQWTHISMTYSIINGIRLFINGNLVSSNNIFTDYAASGGMSTITIGTCLQLSTCAVNQTNISPSQFRGKIDELKIFSRELSAVEVHQLAIG